jgi:hypothetical protein
MKSKFLMSFSNVVVNEIGCDSARRLHEPHPASKGTE